MPSFSAFEIGSCLGRIFHKYVSCRFLLYKCWLWSIKNVIFYRLLRNVSWLWFVYNERLMDWLIDGDVCVYWILCFIFSVEILSGQVMLFPVKLFTPKMFFVFSGMIRCIRTNTTKWKLSKKQKRLHWPPQHGTHLKPLFPTRSVCEANYPCRTSLSPARTRTKTTTLRWNSSVSHRPNGLAPLFRRLSSSPLVVSSAVEMTALIKPRKWWRNLAIKLVRGSACGSREYPQHCRFAEIDWLVDLMIDCLRALTAHLLRTIELPDRYSVLFRKCFNQ